MKLKTMRYQEEQKSIPIIIGMGIGAVIALPLGIYSTFVDPTTPFWAPILLIVMEGAFIFLFINFYKLSIKVENGLLEFGFGIINKRFRVEDVVSCQPYQLKFGKVLGIGIRLSTDGAVVYNTRFGKGVKIQIKDKKLAYVLTSKNPESLCEALKK